MPVVTDGGRGAGVDVLGGTDYPLVAPSDDVRGLLADFHLAHEVRDARLPLRLAWLHGFCRAQSSCGSAGSAPSDGSEPSHEADVLVKDSDGRTVFDSTEATWFYARGWGDRFRLYEWRTDAAVCRALVHAGANDAEDVRVYPHELVPERAVLDERASEIVPRRVTGFVVSGERTTDAVEFLLGYNVAMDPAAAVTGLRAGSRVVVTAEPGGGLGRYPSCEEPDTVIRRINGVGPDAAGNLALSLTGCYWAERPVLSQAATAEILPATLRLNNSCGPCCECADYENTYHGVRRLYTRFQEVGVRAQAVRATFRENIARWEAQRACRKAQPSRVTAVVSAGGYLDVGASFGNTDDDCKYGVELRLAFSHTRDLAGELVAHATVVSRPGGGTERAEPSGEWPELYYEWPSLDPGRAATLRTRLRFDSVKPGDSVTVTATPYVGGEARPAAEATAALHPYGV